MTRDVFERNISKLVRQAALPDSAATARGRFLREAEPAPASRSRTVAIAAAALLMGALIYGASRPKPQPEFPLTPPVARPPTAPAVTAVPEGNDLLQLTLKVLPGKRAPRNAFVLSGRTSKLPDDLVVRVRTRRMEESFDGRRLVPQERAAYSGTSLLEKGAFEVTWEDDKAGPLRIDVSTPDDLQERDVLARLPMKESERTWSFTSLVGDERLLPRVDAQLAELADFVREAQALVTLVETVSATEEQFRINAKPLQEEAVRLLKRVDGFASGSLYPAGTFWLRAALQNLLGVLSHFTFKEGKFSGAPDYHQKTPGNERVAFSFDGLRAWLDQAPVVAGREFDLWILRDLARGGPRPELANAVKRHAQRPGVAEFAGRLLGPADPKLEDEIRSIAK